MNYDEIEEAIEKEASEAEATNKQAEFLQNKSGHFGRKYRKHRRDNKYYA